MRSTEIKIKKYQAELEEIERELKTLPKGYLIKRGSYYAQRNDDEEIGITKKPGVIRQLCRKKYLLERKKQLDENLSIVMIHINQLEASPKEAIDSFSTAYHGLPTSHFFHPSIDAWLEKPYKKNNYYQEKLIYQSKNGTQVRSKSEAMIANLLEEYNIPYHYEIALQLGTQTKYRDFVIKNPYSGKTIIWEHYNQCRLKDLIEQIIL